MYRQKYTLGMGSKEKTSGKKTGRPPKAKADRRSITLTIRVTERERGRLRKEARKRKVTITEMLLGPWRKTLEK